jgi:hypothetical protein
MARLRPSWLRKKATPEEADIPTRSSIRSTAMSPPSPAETRGEESWRTEPGSAVDEASMPAGAAESWRTATPSPATSAGAPSHASGSPQSEGRGTESWRSI